MAKKTTEVSAPEKYKVLPSEEIVESVIGELEAFIVEGGKQVRETGLKIFWGVGQMLRHAERDHKVNITALVERVVSDNRIKERQMGARNTWFALKVYEFTKGDFEKLYTTEHGENLTVTKLKKLLTEQKPKIEKTVAEIAERIVATMGVEKAMELTDAIFKACKAEKKRLQEERANEA